MIRVALAALVFAFATGAGAAAPAAKSQSPGFYRMMVGDIEVTVVSDGTVELPMAEILKDMPRKDIDRLLARSFLGNPVETSVNAFLVDTGSKLVLVDTGAGSLFGPTLGRLIPNIQAAGYHPEQVDEI